MIFYWFRCKACPIKEGRAIGHYNGKDLHECTRCNGRGWYYIERTSPFSSLLRQTIK